MSDNTKIGFIGFGNMAQAIADGLYLKMRLPLKISSPAPQTGRSSAVIQKTRYCSMQGRSRNSGKFGYRYPGRQALYDG